MAQPLDTAALRTKKRNIHTLVCPEADAGSDQSLSPRKMRGPANSTRYITDSGLRTRSARKLLDILGSLTETMATHGCVGLCITRAARQRINICPTHPELATMISSTLPGVTTLISALDADQQALAEILLSKGEGPMRPLPAPPKSAGTVHELLWKLDKATCKLANTVGWVSTYIFIVPLQDGLVTRSTGPSVTDFMYTNENYASIAAEMRRIVRDQAQCKQ